MGIDTKSTNWGAYSLASANATLGLGLRGTVYVFRNFDNDNKFLFLLADYGFGISIGFRLNQVIRNLGKALLSDKNFSNPASYTKITCNKTFSADDLDW